MKDRGETMGLSLVAALAIAGAVSWALWLVGGDTLRVVFLLLAGAAAVAIVAGGFALVIRAWRKNDNPPVVEKHYYHDGQTKVIERHTIDGRPAEAPKILQLPASGSMGAYPELLRAAYQAGQLRGRTADQEDDAGGQWGEEPT